MRYAIFSDIHGNVHALEAALEDASRQNATHFLFLGDYTMDFAHPNEVVALMKNVPNSRVIQGNKEGYLRLLSNQDPSTWTALQHAPVYWTYEALTPEHLSYLLALEEAAQWEDNSGAAWHLHHTGKAFGPLPLALTREFYAAIQQDKPLASHRRDLAQSLQSPGSPGYLDLRQLDPGVYCFGHSHIQWHLQAGGILLLNPGSCGLPMDHAPGAAYTLCERQGSQWQVEERRVAYDIERTIAQFTQTQLYARAAFWSKLNCLHLRTAKSHALEFLAIVDAMAPGYGAVGNAYPNEAWNAAIAKWEEMKGMVSGGPLS